MAIRRAIMAYSNGHRLMAMCVEDRILSMPSGSPFETIAEAVVMDVLLPDTALLIACRRGDVRAVTRLRWLQTIWELPRMSPLVVSTQFGCLACVLALAIEGQVGPSGSLDRIKFRLDDEAVMALSVPSFSADSVQGDAGLLLGETQLLLAITAQDLGRVKALIRNGMEGLFFQSLIFERACRSDNCDIVSALIDAGCRIDGYGVEFANYLARTEDTTALYRATFSNPALLHCAFPAESIALARSRGNEIMAMAMSEVNHRYEAALMGTHLASWGEFVQDALKRANEKKERLDRAKLRGARSAM